MYITTPIRLVGGSTGIQKSCELKVFFSWKILQKPWCDIFFFCKKISWVIQSYIIIFLYLLVSVRFPNFAVLLHHKRSQQIDSILEAVPPNKKVELSASATNFSWLFPPGFVGSPQSLGFSTPRNCAFETFGRKNKSHRSWGKLGNFELGVGLYRSFWKWCYPQIISNYTYIGYVRLYCKSWLLRVRWIVRIPAFLETPVRLLNQMLTVSRPIRPSFTPTFFGDMRNLVNATTACCCYTLTA